MVLSISPVYTVTRKISKLEVEDVFSWLKEQPDIQQERIDVLDKEDDRYKYAEEITNTLLLLSSITRKQIRCTFVVDNFAEQLEELLEIFSFPIEIKCDFLFSYSKLNEKPKLAWPSVHTHVNKQEVLEKQTDVTKLCDEFRSLDYERIFEAHMNGINNTTSSTTIRDVFAARIWIRKYELLSFSSAT